MYTPFHESLSYFQVKYSREVFMLSDGAQIAMDWFEEEQPKGE